MKLIYALLLFFNMGMTLNAYESENKLKTAIIGKVAKYVTWSDETHSEFVITVLNNQYEDMFDKVYKDKKIKSKPVVIKYVESVEDINRTDILFVSQGNGDEVEQILKKIKNKEILSVSDLRGFAQRGGCLQLYFVGQKLKLKMNLESVKENEFKVDRTLLRVVDISKGEAQK